MSDRVLGIADKLYRRRHRDRGCRIASSSRAITATAGVPNVWPGASLPIGMRPTVVFDLVGQSAAAAMTTLTGLLPRFNSPFVAVGALDSSGGPPSAIQSAERFSDRYRLSIGIGEGLDNRFDAVEG
jgi:hypothetical protein